MARTTGNKSKASEEKGGKTMRADLRLLPTRCGIQRKCAQLSGTRSPHSSWTNSDRTPLNAFLLWRRRGRVVKKKIRVAINTATGCRWKVAGDDDLLVSAFVMSAGLSARFG